MKESEHSSGVRRKLPPLYQLFFVLLPLAFFLFEFERDGALFTSYELYALIFVGAIYFLALLGGHAGIGRFALVIGAYLALPRIISHLFISLLGESSVISTDFVYYTANFLAIFAVVFYLAMRGVSRGMLFITAIKERRWLWAALLIAVLAVGALELYFRSLSIPFSPPQSLTAVSIGVLFAFANGAMEELWFRSIFLGVLARVFPLGFAVLYQGLLFGIIHYEGTPSGALGIALTFIFGLVIGWLTVRTKSIVPALLIHIASDLYIYFHT